MSKQINKKSGFTLIEFLLVIGMIGILFALTIPLGLNFYRSQMVESAQSELIETLTKARRNAVLMKADSRHGVMIDPDDMDGVLVSFTLYQGDDYSSKIDEYDELYIQPVGLTISASGSSDLSNGDINFSKLVGTTTATGTITIGHSSGTETRAIFIDQFGNAYATST